MINLKDVSLSRGSKQLFENISLNVHPGQKVGLIGHNGSGKTSLLMMLLRKIEPNAGSIDIKAHSGIAHVSQETDALPVSALDFVLEGNAKLTALQKQMTEAEAAGHFEMLAQHHADFAELDGYAAPSRAAQILSHLGFDDSEQSEAVATFSGGWRVRLNLARALFAPSDLLLLDEPTNHLDLKTILWLEKWLRNYNGTLVIISHDRAFLDSVITHVLHIHEQNVTSYTGNYSQFEATFSERLALQQKMFEKQQAKIQHMTRFVDRFKAKASKAKQAQSRVKMIAKMETVAAVQMESPIQFEFLEPQENVNPLVTTTHLDCGYDETKVLQDINIQILRGDRIGVLGNNGAGKSTLIKTLTGEIPAQDGECVLNPKLKVGYFAQHQLEFLDGELSPMDHLRELAEQESDSQCRTYLGSFGFLGDRVFEPLKNFSGGEKSRLALSLIIFQKPALLLLDEPTNHLDLETRMALMFALQNYSGSLLLVSHDRYLMGCITDTLWLIDNKKIKRYEGSLDDYETLIMQADKDTSNKAPKSAPKSHQQRKQSSNRIQQIEKKITTMQKEKITLEKKMCDPIMFEDGHHDEYQALQQRKHKLTTDIQALEEEWVLLHED